MPRHPAFELFESLCQHLSDQPSSVITADDLGDSLLEELRLEFAQTDNGMAFDAALDYLRRHFTARESPFPLVFDASTKAFSVVDSGFVQFVADVSFKRGVGGEDSEDFERKTLERLKPRLTGRLHRVGWPRKQRKKRHELTTYLELLGFDENCLRGRDKDGGFDILWLPPLGAVPLRPVVSLQCKNSFFNKESGVLSAGRANETLQRHSRIRGGQLLFVIFNDYIDDAIVGTAIGWIFIPLGLSDLGIPPATVSEAL